MLCWKKIREAWTVLQTQRTNPNQNKKCRIGKRNSLFFFIILKRANKSVHERWMSGDVLVTEVERLKHVNARAPSVTWVSEWMNDGSVKKAIACLVSPTRLTGASHPHMTACSINVATCFFFFNIFVGNDYNTISFLLYVRSIIKNFTYSLYFFFNLY